MPNRRPTRRPRPDPPPALRSVMLIPVWDGRLVILGPDRAERAIFDTPGQAATYVQCLLGRLEADAQRLRTRREARDGTGKEPRH